MDHRNCNCDGCRLGKDGVLAIQREMLEKHGWYSHYVMGENSANIHTHGLEAFGHVDLQIVAPLDGEVAMDLFHAAVGMIKQGRQFAHNDYVAGIVEDYEVKMVNAYDGDRRVLRMIIPDKSAHLERFNLAEPYDLQYSDLPV